METSITLVEMVSLKNDCFHKIKFLKQCLENDKILLRKRLFVNPGAANGLVLDQVT